MTDSTESDHSNEHTDGAERARRGRRIVLLVVGVAVAAVVVFGTIQLAGRDHAPAPTTEQTSTMTHSPDPTTSSTPGTDDEAEGEGTASGSPARPTPGKLIDEAMGGQEAIDALGDNIEIVAERNHMTPEALKNALLTDKSLQVTPSGLLLYTQ